MSLTYPLHVPHMLLAWSCCYSAEKDRVYSYMYLFAIRSSFNILHFESQPVFSVDLQSSMLESGMAEPRVRHHPNLHRHGRRSQCILRRQNVITSVVAMTHCLDGRHSHTPLWQGIWPSHRFRVHLPQAAILPQQQTLHAGKSSI